MAKDSTTPYDPRQIWTANLAPLVTAAREGASHAARTAARERARSRQARPWWRQHWLALTAAGVAVAGTAGGVCAALSRRRSAAREPGGSGGTPGKPLRSTMEAGRNRVTGAARTVLHKIRNNGPEPAGPTAGDHRAEARHQAWTAGG